MPDAPSSSPSRRVDDDDLDLDPTTAVLFSGHDAYIASVARLCRERATFTDVNIQAEDGVVVAHRIVLSACSELLRSAFLSLPQGLPEFSLMLPGVKKDVVETIIDFLYTVGGRRMSLPRDSLLKPVSPLSLLGQDVPAQGPDKRGAAGGQDA